MAFILIICIVSVNAQISEIEEKLQQQETTKVIVILKPEEKKLFSIFGEEKGIQDKVLDSLNLKEKKILGIFEVKQDFHLKRKYSTVDAFSGEITASGLKKLKNNPNVEGIYLNKKVRTMLQESAPLINADEVWNIQVGGIPITGESKTICVVDTGIDYTHPAIGSAQCSPSGWQIDGAPQTHNEYHSYDAYQDTTWTITKPGYSKIAVHFSKIDVVKDAVYIYIEDPQGAIVQAYSGYYEDEWTFPVPGNEIKIHLVNYAPYSGYGFNIDKVLNGSAMITWNNCGDFIGGYDAVNFDMEPMDDDGHGTHVSGIITSDDSTYKGIAPDAKIIAVKALNNEGWGYDDAILAGIDGCIRYANIYNISVISLSLGSYCAIGGCYNNYCDSSAYAPFINKAAENNILVVAAAGNDGDPSRIIEPACVNKATPVGSTGDGSGGTTADQISSFSDRWSLPMVFAPGASIRSTNSGGGFVDKQGTSMSTPHISGVAALIYQYAALKGIEITPQEIENILIETGKQIDGTNYKRVDALAAINYFEKISINISLKQGWNLVSSPLNFTNLTEVFEPIKDDFVSMFSYDAEYQKFIEIDPFSVEEIYLTHGAWINVLENVNLTIAGKEIENMNIPLFQGWNLVGYPYLIETDINNSDFRNYTTFAYINNSWSSYIPNKTFNSLATMKPGFGYWLKVE